MFACLDHVLLLWYNDGSLVSRSEAKRGPSWFERFKEDLLDFSGIVSIGLAFADEFFRMAKSSHP